MPRFRITVEYAGGDFVGWQRQANGPSIQQSLEEAVEKLSGERVEVVGAGRTDAGVHAMAQVAHFDLESDRFDANTVMKALNFHVKPDPIAIRHAEEADGDFHARFSATKRSYLYRILNRRAPAALDAGRVWHVPQVLDAEAMHDAAQALVGHHDFTTFRAKHCQAQSPEKTLDSLTVSRVGEEIHINAHARSFLHHQIRNITGTLKLVGEGKWTRKDVEDALAAKDRAAGGPTAPPDGLYLVSVGY
ncbi:tRNA pseudouridine(38-40) synthase TruA [Nisaea acidiphila]|uniref:tRNA pseudouridine synthase A n=1 Tax=Nisaea acidiphila TaxID=1862145 RepID=A0A9J7B0H3_9PROT|nr:tRNA pseudouridine(38-40) synthase TruA [Nisaea acidiphila]UUX51980.1 tRNA pseudouridine(38-40) synthase TruA [Nisaea acidiphila]